MVAQAASLRGAATGVILRIEIQHQLASLVVTQTDIPSLFVLTQYLGRLITYFHLAIITVFYAAKLRKTTEL